MISIYVNLVQWGIKTIDDVPTNIRDAVAVIIGGGENE